MPASGFADYLRGRNPDFDQHDPPEDGGLDPSAIVAVQLGGAGADSSVGSTELPKSGGAGFAGAGADST